MKKALLVGINNYPDAPLRGCINDVLLMYKILSQKYNFETRDINILTDRDATKKRIISSLKYLTRDVKFGDTIYFHYSGHGSQVVVDDWTNSDDVDGRDEIICPFDLDWNDPLRDNDIGHIFKSIPEGVKVLVVLDCCHSGTGLRNTTYLDPNVIKTDKDIINRFLPPPISNILSNPRANLDDDLNFLFPTVDKSIYTQKRGFMVETIEQGNAILISGCQDNQTSADAWIGGRYQGALTYTLCDILNKSNFNINYKNLITELNDTMDQFEFEQNPQLECRKEFFNRPFLG